MNDQSEDEARTLPPDALLASAAKLVERARAALNSKRAECVECGHAHAADHVEFGIWKQFEELPGKLLRASESLAASRKIRAIAARPQSRRGE